MKKFKRFASLSKDLELNIKSTIDIKDETIDEKQIKNEPVDEEEEFIFIENGLTSDSVEQENKRNCGDIKVVGSDRKRFQEISEPASSNLTSFQNMISKMDIKSKREEAKGGDTTEKISTKKGIEFNRFSCSHCTYKTNRKSRLRSHLLIHSETKLFKCPECSYECNHKGSLKRHILFHSLSRSNTKLFKCSECTYECNRKGQLKSHLLRHSSKKLFQCSECDYECNQKGSLKIHALTHSDKKLFKCFECSYECNHKGSLNNHALTHYNTKLFKCVKCKYECNQKGNLKRHLKTHARRDRV